MPIKCECVRNWLQQLGMSTNDAQILTMFFETGEELTQRNIERSCDLRQPQVSLSLTALTQQGFVEHRRQITESKGRPVNVYGLARSIPDIISSFEREAFNVYKASVQSIIDLREAYNCESENRDPPETVQSQVQGGTRKRVLGDRSSSN